MTCMQEMLRVNIRQNLQVVIQIATKYSDVLGPVKLIEMFESFKTFEGGLRLFFRYTCAYPVTIRTILLPWINRQPERRP